MMESSFGQLGLKIIEEFVQIELKTCSSLLAEAI